MYLVYKYILWETTGATLKIFDNEKRLKWKQSDWNKQLSPNPYSSMLSLT